MAIQNPKSKQKTRKKPTKKEMQTTEILRDTAVQREKEAYVALKSLKGKRKQVIFMIVAVIVVIAVALFNNLFRYNALAKENEKLSTELTKLIALNDASEPIYWENRDSARIQRDYDRLDSLYQKLFTFRTLDDMFKARDIADNAGFSKAMQNLIYDPNDALASGVIHGSDSASYVDCYYAKSDIFLVGIYDDFYRYLSRVSLDVLADYNITLILFLDVDESGEIIDDACYIGSLPADSVF